MRLRLIPGWLAIVALPSLLQTTALAAPPKALVLSTSPYASNVQKNLMQVGGLASIDTFDGGQMAPTLSQLQGYDTVAVYAQNGMAWKDAAATGNALADYVDAGGGVVMFAYAAEETGPTQIAGRYAGTYSLLTPQAASNIKDTGSNGGSTFGMVLDMSSPIVAGISAISCGLLFGSCHQLTSPLQHGATMVATWDDSAPLVVRGNVNGHNVVELNIYPEDDSAPNGEWSLSPMVGGGTDAARLIRNALVYVVSGVSSSVKVDKTTLKFADQPVGTSSMPQTLTYTNTGTAAITLNSIAPSGANSGDFNLTPGAAVPATLAAGATFTAKVVFLPTATGARSTTIAANFTVAGQPTTLSVPSSGNGLAPTLTITPAQLDLGSSKLGMPLAGKFTIANNAVAPNTVSAVTVTTDAASFSVTSTRVLPVTLLAGASFDVNLTFQSMTPGPHNGVVTVASQLPARTLNVTAATGDPKIQVSSGSLLVGKQHVGVASPPQPLTIDNIGFSDLVVSSIAASGPNAGDFAILSKLPLTIPAGKSGPYAISFKPARLGASNATVTVTSNDTKSGPQSYAISGDGVAFSEMVAPTVLDFGSQKGGTTTTRTVTVTNTSTAPLNIVSLPLGGANAASFSLMGAPSLPALIGAGMSQTLTVAYSPKSAGTAAATLTVGLDDPAMATTVVMLKGSATAGKLTVVPPSIDFGSQAVNSTSNAQAVVITNTGNATITLMPFTLGGADAASFAVLDNPTMPVPLAGGAAMSFHVTFAPTAHAPAHGELDIPSDDPMTPISKVQLKGAGAQPQIAVTPLSLDFGTVPAGTNSTNKPITINNPGDADLSLNLVTIDNSANFSDDAPANLVVKKGGSATVNVQFTPMMAGSQTGKLTITPTDTAILPVTVSLAGNAIALTLLVTPSIVTFPIITVGKKSPPAPVTLQNTSSSPVSLGMIVADTTVFTIDDSMTQKMLMPGAQTMFNVNFAPTMDGPIDGKISIYLANSQTPLVSLMAHGEGLVVHGAPQQGGCSAAGGTGSSTQTLVFLVGLLLMTLTRRRRHRAH